MAIETTEPFYELLVRADADGAIIAAQVQFAVVTKRDGKVLSWTPLDPAPAGDTLAGVPLAPVVTAAVVEGLVKAGPKLALFDAMVDDLRIAHETIVKQNEAIDALAAAAATHEAAVDASRNDLARMGESLRAAMVELLPLRENAGGAVAALQRARDEIAVANAARDAAIAARETDIATAVDAARADARAEIERINAEHAASLAAVTANAKAAAAKEVEGIVAAIGKEAVAAIGRTAAEAVAAQPPATA